MGFLAPVFSVVAGFIGSGLGQAILGIGISLITSKMEQARAKKAMKAAGGTQFEREYGESVSRKVACGYVGIAGHDCYVNTWGEANSYLEQVFLFSDYPCDGLSRVWAGGKLLDLVTADGKIFTIASGDYAGLMSFVFYDGTQTTADAAMVVSANPAGRWTEDHVGSGLCWVKVNLIYNSERLAQFPEFFFELRGARLYDPRKDSSVGGNGNHRWGDYSTHEFSQNPIIMDYNYRRGFSWNDDLFLGMDMPQSDLPFDQYVTAANICDEIAGGEPRYRCSILLDAELDHGDNIDALMTACGGIVVDGVEGSWPIVGTEQPIVAVFTDEDLAAGEPLRFRLRRSQADLVNVVSGTYQEPANMWSPAGYDPQTDAATVAIDRRTRDVPLSFPQVSSKRQANQLASIYFNENRYEATAEVVLRPGFRNVKAGDWIYWNSENEQRRRVYVVTNRSIRALDADSPRNVSLSLQERDGSIYAGVGVNPPVISLPNADPVYLAELQDWFVIPVQGVGADGRSYPAFRMSWSSINDVTVRAIAFEWWLKTEPLNRFTREVPVGTTIGFIQEGILGLTEYEFRHKLLADRVTSWSGVKTVVSLEGGNSFIVELENLSIELRGDVQNLRELVDADLPAQIIAETEARIAAIQGQADALSAERNERTASALETADRYRALLNELDVLRDYVAETDFGAFTKIEQLRTTLTARIGSVVASFDEQITVAASATAALSERTTSLEASTSELSASLISVEQASVDRDNAMAVQISGISAGTDNQFDPAALWLFNLDAQGWTGDVAVSVSNGYLRPGDSVGTYVASPAGLAVDANIYRQVRARIRKTGAPVWEGACYWKGLADASWDVGRSSTVAEPIFDAHGVGLITFDMPWTGAIDQIRLDLSAAQSATDYFEFDWISVGSPSPGASRGELLTEQQARASGDNANAASVTALQALLQEVDGDVAALADGVSAIETSVQTLADGVAAQSQSITDLTAEVEQKATTSALQALAVEVAAIESGGGIISQGQAITALRGELSDMLAEVADHEFAAFVQSNDVRKAMVSATQTLTTRMDLTDSGLSLLADAVTLVQAAIPELASSSALTALSSRVDLTEGSVSAVASALTAVEAEVDGVSAGGTFKMAAATGPTGYARIAAQARVNGGDGYRSAGWYLDVPTNPALPTQFIVDAERFAVTNGSEVLLPFVYEGGVLKLAIAHIQTLLSGTINFGGGKVIINENGITVSS